MGPLGRTIKRITSGCPLLAVALCMGAGMVGCTVSIPGKVVRVDTAPVHALRPVPSAGDVAKAQRVTAAELYRIYSQNLILGATPDQRFYGQLLVVSGEFVGINHGLPGRTYLELGTNDKDAFAYAELSPEASSLSSTMSMGKQVQLVCRGAGMMAGSPLLVECRGA